MSALLTRESAAALISAHGFDTSLAGCVTPFISYVAQQARDATRESYDFEANRHLLKLFLMEPSIVNVRAVAQVLALALLRLPESDFLECTYLLPNEVLAEEPVASVVRLGELLNASKFEEFWVARRTLEALEARTLLSDEVAGFDASVRSIMSSLISALFQRAPIAVVQRLLDLQNRAAVEAWIAAENAARENGLRPVVSRRAPGVSSVAQSADEDIVTGTSELSIEGDLVVLPVTDENRLQKKRDVETVHLEKMARVLGSLQ
jgi:hypothetical protein